MGPRPIAGCLEPRRATPQGLDVMTATRPDALGRKPPSQGPGAVTTGHRALMRQARSRRAGGSEALGGGAALAPSRTGDLRPPASALVPAFACRFGKGQKSACIRGGHCVYCSVHAGLAQLVARNLAKVEVAGSNPVARSMHPSGRSRIGPFHIWRRGQAVRQRPAKPLPPVRIRASPPSTARAGTESVGPLSHGGPLSCACDASSRA